jgi:bilirubin oxidase
LKILDDPATDDVLELPTGDYDIPLMLASKQFQANGKLVSPENERVSLYGDVNTVNGQPWPYFNVEPRKYKFRLLDASISRTYKLYLVAKSAPTVRLPFTVVGADAGYLSNSVSTTSLIIAMAERYEIVIGKSVKFLVDLQTLIHHRLRQVQKSEFNSDE